MNINNYGAKLYHNNKVKQAQKKDVPPITNLNDIFGINQQNLVPPTSSGQLKDKNDSLDHLDACHRKRSYRKWGMA